MTNLRALPARLPGLRARDVHDGRNARPADQPHRDGSGCDDVAHHPPRCCSAASRRPQHATSRLSQTQDKLSSGKQITRPSDDPAGASKALQLRASLREHPAVPVATSRTGSAGPTRPRPRSRAMTDLVQRARELARPGRATTPRRRPPRVDRRRDRPADRRRAQGRSQHDYGGRYLFSGTATDTAPYASAAPTHTPATRATIAREIGPGVSRQHQHDRGRVLGGGQAAGDDKLLDVLRDIAGHLRGHDGARLRGTDLDRLTTDLDDLITSARRPTAR